MHSSRRRRVRQAQVVSLVKPVHRLREIDADKITLKYFARGAFDQILCNAVARQSARLRIPVPSFRSSKEWPRRCRRCAARSLSSPVSNARRSALEMTDSITVIGRRCDTPECLSMRLSSRASKAICSTTLANEIRNAQAIIQTHRAHPGFLSRDLNAQSESPRDSGS